jgi:protein TonB
LFLLFTVYALPAQKETEKAIADTLDNKVYNMFDIQVTPKFPGGEQELLKFITDSLQYPVEARKRNLSGTVAIRYVVTKDGSIDKIEVVKDIGGGCGAEAARVVGLMPKWTPGELHGKPVNVSFMLPVRFRLQ